MGQFDSPSEAALSQIKFESLATSPIDRVVEGITSIGSQIAELAGASGASSLNNLVFSLKRAAAGRDEENLIYFAEAVVEDIRSLYRLSDEARSRLEDHLRSEQFQRSMANATLHVPRTNVKTRIKRLARVLTNSLRDGDLEPESVDDLMWYAVSLTEKDIEVLRIVYEMQSDLLKPGTLAQQPGMRANDLSRRWQDWWRAHIGEYRGMKALEFQNSCARLEALGLVGPMPKSFSESPTQNDLQLLLTGLRFCMRLREIASES